MSKINIDGKCCLCGKSTRHIENKQYVCPKHLKPLGEFYTNSENIFPLCPECNAVMYKTKLKDGTLGYSCAYSLDIWASNKQGRLYRIDLISDPRV